MRPLALCAALVAGLVAVFPAPAVGGASRTHITSEPPYLLGADVQRVIRADPLLRPGARVAWGAAGVVVFSRLLPAPLRDAGLEAELAVIVHRGRVGAVTLYWPSYALRAEEVWRANAFALLTRVLAAYDRSLVRRGWVSRHLGAYLELRDRGGNRLVLEAPRNEFSITLAYLWSPYARMLDGVGRKRARGE